MKAQFGGVSEDYGPCACGKRRATMPVAIPPDWEEFPELSGGVLFAAGYDYRRVFGPSRREDNFRLNFSACVACCHQAELDGIAEAVEDVGFSSNALAEALLSLAAEGLQPPSD